MSFSIGEVVLLPIPFTDLTSRKVRPEIVIGHNSHPGDLFVVPIFSVLQNVDSSEQNQQDQQQVQQQAGQPRTNPTKRSRGPQRPRQRARQRAKSPRSMLSSCWTRRRARNKCCPSSRPVNPETEPARSKTHPRSA